MDSNSASPQPTGTAAAGCAHNAKPPAIKAADNGTRRRFATGPVTDTRPKVAAHSGSRRALTARLASNGDSAFGADGDRSRAMQAPKLIRAPGDNAADGFQNRRTAAERTSAENAPAPRSRSREALQAASMSHARSDGGSAPAMSA